MSENRHDGRFLKGFALAVLTIAIGCVQTCVKNNRIKKEKKWREEHPVEPYDIHRDPRDDMRKNAPAAFKEHFSTSNKSSLNPPMRQQTR